MHSSTPYLTVVAASRNDDHGGDPLVRTQIFIKCFARQCEKYKLPAELILVDWNPVEGRPGLAGVLQLPAEASFCQARVITVPNELHRRFKYGDKMVFFQMIAKNVGIRRARGEFIVATNIDIIFSDELMKHLADRRLDPKKMIRVDRNDIQNNLSASLTLDETLEYAWNNPVRSNRRFGPKSLMQSLYDGDLFKRNCLPNSHFGKLADRFQVIEENGVWSVRPKPDCPLEDLHTNACGDFTLLSRHGWETITGYPEFEAFSFNIDSVGIAAAHYAGFEEVALLPPCVCFHIEHSIGSGWTPEGEKKLFARLNEKEILNPEWHVLNSLVDAMRAGKISGALNAPSWGLADFDLPEEALHPGRTGSPVTHPRAYSAPTGLTVGALRPEFDLDRLSLWTERRQSPVERLTQIVEDTKRWAEEAESRATLAAQLAAENENWARAADARAAELSKQALRNKQWAKDIEHLLEIEKKRASEAILWAREADSRTLAARKLTAETEGWARNSDRLLLVANKRVEDLERYLREHREWALRCEAEIATLKERLKETAS